MISDPLQIWSIMDNLDVTTEREGKGDFITHVNKGEGPFQVIKTYYYSEDPLRKGFPKDAYFRINILIKGILKTGWVTGVTNGNWRVSFTDPAPKPVPSNIWKYTVEVDPITGVATITKIE